MLFMPESIGWDETLARLAAAALFSAALGVERYVHKKPIDFRPFIIISVVSAALMIGITEFALAATDDSFSIDPAKVISGVLTGIGFLGAGALFREKDVVRGAGSAAAIWASGGIGILCGLGYLWLAGIIAVFLILLLLFSNDLSQVHTAENGDDRGDSG